jgi:hypothetical protein
MAKASVGIPVIASSGAGTAEHFKVGHNFFLPKSLAPMLDSKHTCWTFYHTNLDGLPEHQNLGMGWKVKGDSYYFTGEVR